MAILNLSISEGPFNREGSTSGLLVRESDDYKGPRDIRLVWSTELGTETQAYWNITITFSGYQKGMPFKSSTKTYTQRFAASACNETKPYGANGRVWWSHSLDIGGLLTDALGSSKQFMYSSRQYDSMDFTVSIYSEYVPGFEYAGSTTSGAATLSFSIGYLPEYTLTQAYYAAGDILVLEYETTWTRIDDRYWVARNANEPGGMCTVDGSPLLTAEATGTIAARGRIEIPTSALTQHVAGKNVYFNVSFNAAYRPVGMSFNRASATLLVQNMNKCSTPTITVVESGERIRIKTGDSGDNDTPCEFVSVKMENAKYSFDEVSVPVGDVAEFVYAPFGDFVKFSAIGFTGDGAVSEKMPSVVANSVESDVVVIDSISGSMQIQLEYLPKDSVGPDVSVSADRSEIKLAGRRRPSAFYGVGGSASINFSGILLFEDGIEYEQISEMGDILARFPDGRRYAIAPDISVSRKNSSVVNVDISGNEVDA